ncbi:MAG: cytochrome c [Bryobacterales bacterium]|nr:cytochrome c [Bryobacterales bacterium]
MKTAQVRLLWMFVALSAFGLLSACSSQSQPERAAARQRPADSPVFGDRVASSTNASVQLVQAAGPAPAAAAQDSKGDPEAGKETFEQCSICHNIDSDEAKMGPSLKGLFKKDKLASGKAASEENVTAVIKDGGNGMPGYEDLLDADEMKNLIAYLRTL